MEEINEGVIPESSAGEEVTEAPVVNDEESAASTDAPDKENAVTEGDAAAPQKPDAKARIRQLHAERERAREDAAYWRGQAEAKKTPEPVTQPEPVNNGPTPDQFATYEDYLDARADFRAEQKYITLEAAKEQRVKEDAVKAAEEKEEQSFKSKVEAFKAKTPDFEDTVRNPDLRISKVMYEAMRETEVGPQIAYHLGKNPQEAARIAGLSPIAAIKEIGKLEAKFSKEPAPTVQTKTISDAPEPPSIVQGTANGQKDESKMTDTEWYAHWKSEKAKKMQARAQR